MTMSFRSVGEESLKPHSGKSDSLEKKPTYLPRQVGMLTSEPCLSLNSLGDSSLRGVFYPELAEGLPSEWHDEGTPTRS